MRTPFCSGASRVNSRSTTLRPVRVTRAVCSWLCVNSSTWRKDRVAIFLRRLHVGLFTDDGDDQHRLRADGDSLPQRRHNERVPGARDNASVCADHAWLVEDGWCFRCDGHVATFECGEWRVAQLTPAPSAITASAFNTCIRRSIVVTKSLPRLDRSEWRVRVAQLRRCWRDGIESARTDRRALRASLPDHERSARRGTHSPVSVRIPALGRLRNSRCAWARFQAPYFDSYFWTASSPSLIASGNSANAAAHVGACSRDRAARLVGAPNHPRRLRRRTRCPPRSNAISTNERVGFNFLMSQRGSVGKRRYGYRLGKGRYSWTQFLALRCRALPTKAQPNIEVVAHRGDAFIQMVNVEGNYVAVDERLETEEGAVADVHARSCPNHVEPTEYVAVARTFVEFLDSLDMGSPPGCRCSVKNEQHISLDLSCVRAPIERGGCGPPIQASHPRSSSSKVDAPMIRSHGIGNARSRSKCFSGVPSVMVGSLLLHRGRRSCDFGSGPLGGRASVEARKGE